MCGRDPAVGIAATTDEEQEQMPNESNRKHAAVSFLKLAASGKLDEAYGNYVAQPSAITIRISQEMLNL